MNATRLLEWSDLETKRRNRARGGLAAVPTGWYALIAGFLFVAEVGRRLVTGNQALAVHSASQLWLAVTAVACVVAVFGAPFRMWWRRDAALLARLAIPGEALVGVGIRRSVRVAGRVFAPCAMAALAFGPLAGWDLALRHLTLATAGAVAVAALGPASAVFGGATVASDRAQAAVASMAGDVSPPKTTYLGLFTSLSASALFVAFLVSAPWLTTGAETAIGPGVAIPIVIAIVSVVALALAVPMASKVGNAAAREVAALDYERLAHIERTSSSLFERAAAAALARDGKLVFHKDARLLRRRYPAPYFVLPLLVLGMWVVAVVGASSTWLFFFLASAAIYNVIVARRASLPPVEHGVLLRTLAVRRRQAAQAKRVHVALRATTSVVLGGAPAVALAAEPWTMAVVVGAAAVATVVVGVKMATTGW